MKNKHHKSLISGALLLSAFGILFVSCEKLSETPPELKSMNNRRIDLPDATLLTGDEAAAVEDLKNEYLEAIK